MKEIMDLMLSQIKMSGISVESVKITDYSESSFGNFSVELKHKKDTFLVIMDRGQFFLDIYDANVSRYVNISDVNSCAMDVYKKESWELWELLKCIQ